MMKPSPVRLTRSKVRRSSCLWPRMVSILSASTSWRSWDEAVSALSLPARPSHSLVDMAAAAGGGGAGRGSCRCNCSCSCSCGSGYGADGTDGDRRLMESFFIISRVKEVEGGRKTGRMRTGREGEGRKGQKEREKQLFLCCRALS